MKVKVSFTLDLDSEAWQRDYGVAKENVRADVQTYVENGTKDHLRELGLLKEGDA